MKKINQIFLFVALFLLIIFLINFPKYNEFEYPIHENITTTLFWIGEKATEENQFISNTQSVWDEKWLIHYGGIDDPYKRNSLAPKGFTPLENPFYFALPYNDFDENGNRKNNTKEIYWYNQKNYLITESICKNHWIKITKGEKIAYAQWEDVGPFEENDFDYVFESSLPKNKINNNAGLDVSPALRDFLNLKDIDKVSWQFVEFSKVEKGPWKNTITTSGVYWE